MTWNKDTVDDKKIADDLADLSEGKLQMTEDIIKLMGERIDMYCPKPVQNNNRNQNNRNQNNRNQNKRKY